MRSIDITILMALGPMLASCGSSWDIRKGDTLPIGCDVSYFYADGDGDGWGDPDSEPQELCQADVEQGLTASNGRDCDDANPSITGIVGTVCPAYMLSVDGGVLPHDGLIFDEAEFAYLYGADAPVVRHQSAIEACQAWGAEDAEGSTNLGTLATFVSQAEVAEAQSAIEVSIAGGSGVHATFIGIGWDGPSADPDDGQWAWVDNAADGGQANDTLITQAFSWCGGVAPIPGDFFPLLNTSDPNHVPAINAQLDLLRLAMVLDESGNWCLGLPWQAIPSQILDEIEQGTADFNDPVVADVSRYSTSDAHILCKRPRPDPEDYKHLVGAEE